MKKILPLMLLSLTLLAAGGSNVDKIDGRWVCDVPATVGVNKEAAEMYKQAPKLVEEELGNCSIRFDVSRKQVVMRSGKGDKQMNYTVSSDTGDAFTLLGDGERQKFRFTPEGKLVMIDPLPNNDMIFRRLP